MNKQNIFPALACVAVSLFFFACAAQAITWTEAKRWFSGLAFYACLFVLVRLAWLKASVYKAQADKLKAETFEPYDTKHH